MIRTANDDERLTPTQAAKDLLAALRSSPDHTIGLGADDMTAAMALAAAGHAHWDFGGYPDPYHGLRLGPRRIVKPPHSCTICRKQLAKEDVYINPPPGQRLPLCRDCWHEVSDD